MFRFAALAAAIILLSAEALAHCDTMTGPVVLAGQKALATGDIRHALIWVKPAAEGEIRAVFDHTLAVRTLGPRARDLADRYFFETLVRIHRAGEGEPYTGLKDGELHPEPGIESAEEALKAGSVKDLAEKLASALGRELDRSFDRVNDARSFSPADVSAGRRYVEHYVSYIHFVDRVHKMLTPADGVHETEEHHH